MGLMRLYHIDEDTFNDEGGTLDEAIQNNKESSHQ